MFADAEARGTPSPVPTKRTFAPAFLAGCAERWKSATWRAHADPSHAVLNGERLRVAGRLLGHWRDSTTNRYVHLDDATLSQAAERRARAIQRKSQRSVKPVI